MGEESRVNALSIIIASSNPKLAALTVSQVYNQVNNLPVEIICVMEGFIKSQIPQLQCVKYIAKDIEGFAGAYAKDLGIKKSNSMYVAFWDDDNYYNCDAVATILSHLVDYPDIVVFRTEHLTPNLNYVIPRENPTDSFTIGDIDTMCFVVRTDIASKILWSSHKGKQTDFNWISKLRPFAKNVKYVDKIIGQKITSYG